MRIIATTIRAQVTFFRYIVALPMVIKQALIPIGFSERAGNGLHMVMTSCDMERIPRPEITEGTDPASVTVSMRRVPGMKVQDDADLLEYIRKYSTETLAQMAEGTGLSTSTLSRRLKEFKDQGAVERVGGRRSGFWTVRIEDR